MNPESRSLQEQLASITEVLSTIDLHQIGSKLVEKKFLGFNSLSNILDTTGISRNQQASKIMQIVHTQVKLDPSKLQTFLEILQAEDACSVLVDNIMKSYKKCGGKPVNDARNASDAVPQQLHAKCSTELLLKISELGFDWKSTGRRLILNNPRRVDQIAHEESEERHRRERMLLDWQEVDNDDATPQKLIDVLQALKLNETAAQVRKITMEFTTLAGGPKKPLPVPPSYEHAIATDECGWLSVVEAETDKGTPYMVVSDGRNKMEAYKMKKSTHGVALIISNINFTCLEDREDSKVDEARASEIFQRLKYRVVMLKNLTADEIGFALKLTTIKASHLDNKHMLDRLKAKGFDEKNVVLEDDDSFVCCIMTHGALKSVYGSDGSKFNISRIYELLAPEMCPYLIDKPKMFFIQACQGDVNPRAVMVKQDDGTERSSEPSPLQVKSDAKDYQSITPTSDFMISYSAFPTQKSLRSVYEPEHQEEYGGTWYMKALHEVVVKNHCYKKDDLLSMVTKVHKIVQEFECNDKGTIYKQCPYREDTLRYKVYF